MYNMAGTVEETIQGCSAFSPSHVDFRLRKTAWGNGARNTKIIYNYKWQSRSLGAKEFRGPALSIPPSPTFSYPIWMTAWKVGGWSGEKSICIPSPHMHPIKFIRHSHWTKCLAYQDLWEGKRGLQTLLSWTVSSHPDPLYHNQQVAFSKIQAKLLITRLKMLANCNPLPPHIHESVLLLLIKQVPGYWALGRQRFLCSFSLLNHLPQRSSTWIPSEEPATPALL